MEGLLKLSRAIDAVKVRIGSCIYWLILVVVLVCAGNAIIRKLFDISSNAWLELQWICSAPCSCCARRYTLQRNEHIRIDIIYNMLSQRARNWIDIVGHLFFLLPLMIVMIVTWVPFFMRSPRVNEQSGNAGGLPHWPAKSWSLIGFVLLFLQGISELIKRIAVMRGVIPDPHAGHRTRRSKRKRRACRRRQIRAQAQP